MCVAIQWTLTTCAEPDRFVPWVGPNAGRSC
jgi:hypothetical protein